MRSKGGKGKYMASDFHICWTFGNACEANNHTTTLVLSRIHLGYQIGERSVDQNFGMTSGKVVLPSGRKNQAPWY